MKTKRKIFDAIMLERNVKIAFQKAAKKSGESHSDFLAVLLQMYKDTNNAPSAVS